MHGLLTAGLLLAPALARAAGATASPQDNTPSAFITLDVPVAGLENGAPFLSLRLDVHDSPKACGTANVTINGEALAKNGKLALPLVPDYAPGHAGKASPKDTPSAVVRWDTDCVSWGGQDREQLLRLRIVSVNGVDVKHDDESARNPAVVRFRQTAPAHVVLVENAASAFQFNDNHFKAATASPGKATGTGDDTDDTDDADELESDDEEDYDAADLVAWENSLILMHRSVALMHHDMHLRERYIRERFGPDASPIARGPPGFGKHGGPGSDITAFIGSVYHKVYHKVASTARSLYGELLANAFGDDGPRRFRDGPPFDAPSFGPPGFYGPSGLPPRPHCFPGSDRMGPPPPPPPPPSVLFHCPPPPPPPFPEGMPPAPPPERFHGPGAPLPPLPPSFPLKHPHGAPPSDLPSGPPPPSEGPHGGPGGPDGPGGKGPFWVAAAKHVPQDKSKKNKNSKDGEFRGRKMHGHGPDGPPPPPPPPPPGPWNGRPGFGGPGRAPVVKMVAFFALVIVLLFVFARHCRKRQMQRRLRNRRANRPHGFRGLAARFQEFADACQERHELRQARRESHRQRRASIRSIVRSVRRFIFAGEDGDEKVDAGTSAASGGRAALRSSTNGHIETTESPPRGRSPVPSLEDEIAEFRAAADVVGQMIAAEEGRFAIAQTAEARRRQDEDLEQAMRSVSPAATAAAAAATTATPIPASAAFYNQPPPPPPPPPSTATSSSAYSGYGRRDAAGIDSDFDDVESLPPAYSPDDYQYVNLVEASVVADGFQYRPGASP